MVTSPKGIEPEKDYAGEDQQHTQTRDPSSRQRRRPTKTRPYLSKSNKYLVMSPRWGSTPRFTNWLTASRNVTSTLTVDRASWELQLWEDDSWERGQFGNPEEGERPLFEAATEQRLVKTLYPVVKVIFGVCNSLRLSQLFVVTFSKCPINPITNPNPVFSHTQ
jgi:hypothetical protein